MFSSVDGHLEIFPFLILVNNAILTLLYKFFFSFEHIPWSRIFGFSGLAYKRGRGKEREGRREDACICMHIDAHYPCASKHFICYVISSSFLLLLEQNEMDVFLLAKMFFLVTIFSSFIPIVLHPGVSILFLSLPTVLLFWFNFLYYSQTLMGYSLKQPL